MSKCVVIFILLEVVSAFVIASILQCKLYGVLIAIALMIATIIFDYVMREDI